MLPYLIRSNGAPPAGRASELVPPLHFRPLGEKLSNIRYSPTQYEKGEGATASQRLGFKYESRVHQKLRGLFPHYHATPHVHFLDDQMARTVRPDAVAFFNTDVFIFEMKYQHCPEAWWQLEKLYAPLLRELWSCRKVSCVEICRSYDPATPFPCKFTLVEDLVDWTSTSRPDFGVFQWRV